MFGRMMVEPLTQIDPGVDVSGGSPRKITPEAGSQYQRCTPDGKWLVYLNNQDNAIRKIAMSGGDSEILLPKDRDPDARFTITPDGRSLVVNTQAAANGQREIDFISLASGQVERRVPLPGDSRCAYLTPDGQSVWLLSAPLIASTMCGCNPSIAAVRRK